MEHPPVAPHPARAGSAAPLVGGGDGVQRCVPLGRSSVALFTAALCVPPVIAALSARETAKVPTERLGVRPAAERAHRETVTAWPFGHPTLQSPEPSVT